MSEAWRDQAACHPDRRPEGMSRAEWTAMFFPGRGDMRSLKRALAICEGCPVKAECAASAPGDCREGVWGGASGRRRRLTAASHSTGKRRTVPVADVDRAITLVDQGLTVAEASRRTGVTRQTINNWRWRAEIVPETQARSA